MNPRLRPFTILSFFAFSLVPLAAEAQNPRVYVIPDTQYYTKFEAGVVGSSGDVVSRTWLSPSPSIYKGQMERIAADPDAVMAFHLGDITNYDDSREWDVALEAHSVLNGTVRYTVTSGNHDYPYRTGEPFEVQSRNDDGFGSHFSLDYLQDEVAADTASWWGYQEHDADGDLNSSKENFAALNSYGEFEMWGEDWVVVNLEFAPRKESLCWANEVIENQFSNHNVIIVTHCYLHRGVSQSPHDGALANCSENYKVIGADGSDTWRELVSRHNNIMMVHSGHVGGSDRVPETSFENHPSGPHTVWQFLTDYQFEQFGGFSFDDSHQNFGNGWLRWMTFEAPNGGQQRVLFDTVSDMEVEDPFVITFPSAPHEIEVLGFDGNFQLEYYSAQVEEDYGPDGSHKFFIDMAQRSSTYLGPSDLPRLKEINDFTMNTTSSGQQRHPRIAARPGPVSNGATFRAIWEDSEGEGFLGVRARGVKSDGCHTTGSDRAQRTIGQDESSALLKHSPEIAVSKNGNYVVVWTDTPFNPFGQQTNSDVMAQGFDEDGEEIFGPMRVNADPAGTQEMPSVAINDAGEFVIVWADDRGNDGDFQIYGALFDAQGNKRTDFSGNPAFDPERPGDFTVNHDSTGNQTAPTVAMVPSSKEFVVAWADNSDSGKGYQIFAASFGVSTSGIQKKSWGNVNERGGDVTINQSSEGHHRRPDIAMDVSGQFAVTWQVADRAIFGPSIIGRRIQFLGAMDSYLGFFDDGGERIDEVRLGPAEGHQVHPRVDMLGDENDGGVVHVVWQDDRDANGWWQIYREALSYSSNGLSSLGWGTVNKISHGQQVDPDVALTSDGQVMVVWADDINKNDIFEIVANSFDAFEAPPSSSGPVESRINYFPPSARLGQVDFSDPQGDPTTPYQAVQLRYSIEREPLNNTEMAFFENGFAEIISEPFDSDETSVVGTKVLADVFIDGSNPSGYAGAVQWYLTVPGSDHIHRFISQAELSSLPVNQISTLELPVTPQARELLLSDFARAQVSLTVNTETTGPMRVGLNNLRFGGDLSFHPDFDCDSPECLALCTEESEDCDGDPLNGCEISLSTDPVNCGGCGVVCESGSCVAGQCAGEPPQDASSCNSSTAVDLGATGEFVFVPTDACVMVSAGYPTWWGSSRRMKVQNNSGTQYPLLASWSNACTGSEGSFVFDGNWDDMIIPDTSDQCPTFIRLAGSGMGSMSLRYYGE